MLAGARKRAVSLLRPILPARARLALRRIDEGIDPLHIALHRRLRGERRPIPPRLLRERTGSATIEGYFATGERYATLVQRGVERAGVHYAGLDAVLDFGCGAGRALQSLRGVPGPALFGCDIHEPSVRWVERNLPGIDVSVSPFRPPLSYPDGRFDCLYAWSVFSHLDRQTQDQWLEEFRRVLVPGGVALISICSDHSERAASLYAPSLELSRVRSQGVVFIRYPESPDGVRRREFVPTDEPYGLTFVSRDHVRAAWSERFEIVEIMPLAFESIQDVVVLRHRG